MLFCQSLLPSLFYLVLQIRPLKTWGEIEHSPAAPQRQGPGHEPCLTFAQHCSRSVFDCYILSSFTDKMYYSNVLMK